jgi:hypothetical protein
MKKTPGLLRAVHRFSGGLGCLGSAEQGAHLRANVSLRLTTVTSYWWSSTAVITASTARGSRPGVASQ